jgi:hypothetical protein
VKTKKNESMQKNHIYRLRERERERERENVQKMISDKKDSKHPSDKRRETYLSKKN